MKINRVGFVGLGAMGSVMSPLLAKGGYQVLGYDLIAKIEKSTGVKQLDTLDGFVEIDAVILMLPNSKIVSEVTTKLLELNSKFIIIDMSSSDPRETKKLGKTISSKGLKFIDAPVSGGVSRAKIGDLMIMAGGNEEDILEVNDLLSIMGTVQYAGP